MSLERIEITPFVVIVGDILQHRRTGHLTLLRNNQRRVLYWSQGELVLIASSNPEDSLGDFLVRRGVISHDKAVQIISDDPTNCVASFHESGVLDLSSRQTLLREWMATLFVPLFSLDEGTAAWTEAQAIDPDKRVFLQSTAALLLEGVRAITNGLVLRRSLGDLKREIAPARNSRFSIDSVALNDAERRIASSLTTPQPIDVFLKHYAHDSVTAARIVIGMLALGIYGDVEYHEPVQEVANFDEMQRDLELLSAIGSSDPRSLRAVALSRQLPRFDHYQVLDVPRAATRAQITNAGDALKKQYDPLTFPPIVRDAVNAINNRIDEALVVLKDASRRASYDKLLKQVSRGDASLEQKLTQRSIAEQNFARARELMIDNDFYGAIVLLKQAVQYAPDHSESWFLLGTCQERNPKWRREAAESFQQALSIDPNYIDALIALGDLYKAEGLASRAQSCYEDVLKISADNQQAKSRLTALKKR